MNKQISKYSAGHLIHTINSESTSRTKNVMGQQSLFTRVNTVEVSNFKVALFPTSITLCMSCN